MCVVAIGACLTLAGAVMRYRLPNAQKLPRAKLR
jgi:hypothetical protein